MISLFLYIDSSIIERQWLVPHVWNCASVLESSANQSPFLPPEREKKMGDKQGRETKKIILLFPEPPRSFTCAKTSHACRSLCLSVSGVLEAPQRHLSTILKAPINQNVASAFKINQSLLRMTLWSVALVRWYIFECSVFWKLINNSQETTTVQMVNQSGWLAV